MNSLGGVCQRHLETEQTVCMLKALGVNTEKDSNLGELRGTRLQVTSEPCLVTGRDQKKSIHSKPIFSLIFKSSFQGGKDRAQMTAEGRAGRRSRGRRASLRPGRSNLPPASQLQGLVPSLPGTLPEPPQVSTSQPLPEQTAA